jgi:Na+/melibiose symporter-like transporter
MEMTNNFDERDQLWMWNSLGGNLGTLIGMMMPAALTFAVTEDLYTVFFITALVFVGVHSSGMAGNVLLIKERPLEVHEVDERSQEEHTAAKPQTPVENATAKPFPAPFVVNLLRCMRNLPFDCIIRSYMLDYLSLGMVTIGAACLLRNPPELFLR